MVILSGSLASSSYFQLRDLKSWMWFPCTLSYTIIFSSVYLTDCSKGYQIFNLVFGPLEIPKLQITRNRDSKTGMHCSLILQNTKESTNLNMRHSSAGLSIKFKRYSKAARVVPCHGAAYCCRLPSSSSKTVHYWDDK